MAACAGPGGWTAENAQAAGFTYTMPDGQVASGNGGWTATNTEVDGVKSTVLQIVNKVGTSPIEPTPAEIPLTDDSGPRIGYVVFRKVDELGNLLPGGHFVGESCTKRDSEQYWQCESLNDYSWFEREPMADDYGYTPPSLFTAGAADQFHVDIPMRNSTWGPNAPIEHCIHIAETEAPAGYEIQPGMTTVCLGPGGWTVENAIAAGWEDPTGDWTVTNSHTVVNLSTTLTLVNPKIETEEPTPTTPTETVVPVPPAGGGTPTATPVETTKPVAAGNLAATGAGEFAPIGLAGAAILATGALILLRRRASE